MPKSWKEKLSQEPAKAVEATTAHARETDALAAEIGQSPSIDLHGLSSDEALHALDQFIHHEIMQGTDAVRIVHGRGDGILRRAVQAWLKQHPDLVEYSRDATHHAQLGGVTIAALVRMRS